MSLVEDVLWASLQAAWDAQSDVGGALAEDGFDDGGRIASIAVELGVMEADLLDLVTKVESGAELSRDDLLAVEMLEGEVARLVGELKTVMAKRRARGLCW